MKVENVNLIGDNKIAFIKMLRQFAAQISPAGTQPTLLQCKRIMELVYNSPEAIIEKGPQLKVGDTLWCDYYEQVVTVLQSKLIEDGGRYFAVVKLPKGGPVAIDIDDLEEC